MKWTNKYHLPEPLAQSVMRDEHVQSGDWSVSETCGPTQLAILRRRHGEEIVQDVSDHIWILLGRGIHFVIEKFKGGSHQLLEHHMKWDVLIGEVGKGVLKTVSGTLDYYDSKKSEIHDWKVTGIYKVTKGKTEDWALQLNRYNLALVKTGKNQAKKLINQCIIRDWMKRDSVRPDYPQVPFVPITQLTQPLKEVEAKLVEDVTKLEDAKGMSDEDLADVYPCTQEERWGKADTFAVCKSEGRAVPKGIHYDETSACEMLQQKGKGYHVEHRPGENTRCESYCAVQPFCHQFAQMKRKPERIAG